MKNVYFVQANMQYGNSLYLPYATACLAAYAWQFESIQKHYCFKQIFYRRDSIESMIKHFADADIVAFSCYNWTFEYNKELARAIKKIRPECKIIFGGHNVSDNNDILSDCDYVDYLVFGEGEIAFKNLLDALAGLVDFSLVPCIAYRSSGKIIKTERREIDDLNELVSPYLTGYFNEIIENNPDIEFCATVETNRGCPYQCAFCDWCYSSKIRIFDLEKVKQEIIWCAKNKIEYIFCADSNFGILPRDMEIARFVVEVKKQYAYPFVFNSCFAKNSNKTVYDISKLFYDYNLNKAATLAYQSVNPVALKNIGRQNFTVEAFSELMKKYNEQHIPTYTEMILGLPGETYESFCDGICQLVEAGQQSALTIYCCQIYPNALMGNKVYQEKFGIKTVHVPLNFIHSSPPKKGEIIEYVDLVVETNDMPFDDIMNAILFCACIQCFHYLGLLKFVAVYLNKQEGISYRKFYGLLFDYIFSAKGTGLNDLFEKMRKQCTSFSNGEWTYFNKKFGEIGWYLEEGIFMELISDYEKFWEEIMPFLSKFGADNEEFDELLKFQRFVIKLPNQEYVKNEFKYDFLNYFNQVLSGETVPLKKRKNRIEAFIPNPVKTWEEYGRRVMLFAKKKAGTFVIGDVKNVKNTYL